MSGGFKWTIFGLLTLPLPCSCSFHAHSPSPLAPSPSNSSYSPLFIFWPVSILLLANYFRVEGGPGPSQEVLFYCHSATFRSAQKNPVVVLPLLWRQMPPALNRWSGGRHRGRLHLAEGVWVNLAHSPPPGPYCSKSYQQCWGMVRQGRGRRGGAGVLICWPGPKAGNRPGLELEEPKLPHSDWKKISLP